MTDDMRPTPKLSNPEEVRQRLESWLAETRDVRPIEKRFWAVEAGRLG